MTYEESIENCRNVAAEFGLESKEYNKAKQEMLIAGREKMKSLSKTKKFINFIYKIQWLLKRRKY
jgi:hypothetical protein